MQIWFCSAFWTSLKGGEWILVLIWGWRCEPLDYLVAYAGIIFFYLLVEKTWYHKELCYKDLVCGMVVIWSCCYVLLDCHCKYCNKLCYKAPWEVCFVFMGLVGYRCHWTSMMVFPLGEGSIIALVKIPCKNISIPRVMGHIFQVEWWARHPSGCLFGCLWPKKLEKAMTKALKSQKGILAQFLWK